MAMEATSIYARHFHTTGEHESVTWWKLIKGHQAQKWKFCCYWKEKCTP